MLRPAGPEDAAICAAIFDAWVDATDWMPRVHSREAIERHFRETVLATCAVTVAERAAAIVGFLALRDNHVDGLYLAAPARRQGVGAALVGAAKAAHPAGLTLWTFVANQAARAFYAKQGFTELRRSAGDNEERLPDILLYWRGRCERVALGAPGAGGGRRHPARLVRAGPGAERAVGAGPGAARGPGARADGAGRGHDEPGAPATAGTAPGSGRALEHDGDAAADLEAQPRLSRLGHLVGDARGVRPRGRSRHPPRHRHRARPDDERERDALGDRQPDGADPRRSRR